MALTITQRLCPSSKWSIKCPYSMTPQYVVIHNTANDASADNEITYMLNNNFQTSYHYAVDDQKAVQGIPLNRNAWHAGDGAYGNGNRKGVAIEICYSKSGGSRFTKAEENAAELAAKLLKQYGWGIDRLKKHQDFSGKYCPHRTLDMGWQRFVNMVQAKLSGQATPVAPSTSGKINVAYQAYDSTHGWLSEITNWNSQNSNGYAGWLGYPIKGFRAKSKGDASVAGYLEYRAHRKGGSWYGWRRDYNTDSAGDTFAGTLKTEIDAIQMRIVGVSGKHVRYRVHDTVHEWLDWITDYNDVNSNGYAGWMGYAIDGIQIEIV